MLDTTATSCSYATTRRFGRAVSAVSVMGCTAILLQACNGSDSPQSVLRGNAAPESNLLGNATVGTPLVNPVRVLVTGTDGQPLSGAKVRWEPSDDGKVSSRESTTDGKGAATVRWTVGTKAGVQTLVAYFDGIPPVVFGANSVADRPAVIRLSADLIRVTVIGDTVRLSSTVEDQFGNPVSTPVTVSLESGRAVLLVSGSNFVARNRGNAIIRAAADTAISRMTVMVDPSPPIVTRVSPDTLRPGGIVVVEGFGFSLLPDALELTVGGQRANVLSATGTRIEAQLPSSYPCAATVPKPVRVTVAGASDEVVVPLRNSKRLALNPGESAQLLDAQDARCTELAAPAGLGRAKYVVAVINTSLISASIASFELRGTGTGGLAGRAATLRPASTETSSAVARGGFGAAPGVEVVNSPTTRRYSREWPSVQQLSQADAAHDRYLERQRAISERFGSPTPEWRRQPKRTVSSIVAPTALGDTVTRKALFASCTSGRDVRARVVCNGAKTVILEDVTAPKAGMMDIEYQRIGDEYDAKQYPLMVASIGDPLAMNSTMDGDGKITMLFTRYVNDSLPGITGYVSACNFYPRSVFAASNQDEVIYARVANPSELPSEWLRSMRGTIIHESKQLASFGIRLLLGTPFEESWLEESTGRIAEELYSRTFSAANLWKANANFAQTVGCELSQCDDRPLMMWKHFSVLHQYQKGVDTLSPLGSSTGGDFTFYASGWSLVRWAIDHYATNESDWLKAVVRGGQLTGVNNLVLETGRSAGEMLADWALAQAVDDVAGFVPARPQLSFPSWNQPDVFKGLSGWFPGAFEGRPLKSRAMSFGSFTTAVPKLRGYSSSYFVFDGEQTGSQLLELRGEAGGALPPSGLRVAVVRVE